MPAETLKRPSTRDAAPDEPAQVRRVALSDVVVEGVTVMDVAHLEQLLRQQIGPMQERGFSLADMRSFAAWVQERVQEEGRPYARAYLPPQELSSGVLRIAVVEGRYGEVKAEGSLASQVRPWLAPLKPGNPIGPELERQAQLLAELPGVQSGATMAPGERSGEGDVTFDVSPGTRWGGAVRADNHGNRFAGQHRAVASVWGNSLATLGDRAVLSAGMNDERGWQGQMAYSLPMGGRGDRLALSFARSTYELGRDFRPLDADGSVDTYAAVVSTPLIMTSVARLEWQLGLQSQSIVNAQHAVDVTESRRLHSATTVLQGSRRLDGGGVVWGRVAMEGGRAVLPTADQMARDARTAKTRGGFVVFNGDLAWLQPLDAWTVYARASGQLAAQNVDPARKFVLGGPEGVRAWPVAEGAGDEGLLMQTELRYRLSQFPDAEPFGFFDAGHLRINHTPWAFEKNSRSLAGVGVGLRWASSGWSALGTVGWRMGPYRTRPLSDSFASNPQFWLQLGYAL